MLGGGGAERGLQEYSPYTGGLRDVFFPFIYLFFSFLSLYVGDVHDVFFFHETSHRAIASVICECGHVNLSRE